MHRRLVVLIFILALVAAACGASVADEGSSTPPGETSSTTPAESTQPADGTAAPATSGAVPTPVTEFELAPCSQDGDFDLVCEAHSILTQEYVDELDEVTLAEAAARGIEEFLSDMDVGGEPAISDPQVGDGFTCQVPSDPFEVVCAAAADALDEAPLETIEEAAIRGMLEFGLNDPNTVYLPPEVLERIQEENAGEISGIGALVRTEEVADDGTTEQCFVLSETCRMVIVGVIEGAPAEAAGLQVGDITVSVDGESVIGWTADEVVSRVRGPVGTQVVLGVERDGKLLEFTITRDTIVVPVVESEILTDRVGYIALSQFTANSDELFHDELKELVDAGVSKLIFDLRNNPGGALTAAVNIASEFLPEGLVLRTESPGDTRSYEVTGDGLATSDEIEVVVLVNGASASASEVVSSALQEAGRATIIGEPTFGKNTVQQQFSLSNGGAVKVTIARWVTPSGASFGGTGVQPDIVVEVPPDAEEDTVLRTALEFLGADPNLSEQIAGP